MLHCICRSLALERPRSMSVVWSLSGVKRTRVNGVKIDVNDPGCVKTLRGITAPGILGYTVTLRAKKRKNLSCARHYDQIRFRFHTAKTRRKLARPPILALREQQFALASSAMASTPGAARRLSSSSSRDRHREPTLFKID